jgi:thioredoxin reductase (NADPH)
MKKDVFIIGAGIAGLTAGVYALRYGMNVYLCDNGMVGGQITQAPQIENYPAMFGVNGFEFSEGLRNWFVSNGGVINNEKVLSVEKSDNEFIITTNKNTYISKTVISANGAKRRTLGCSGEEEFTGRGISWCAQCDGMFFRGKNVAVIGGGNTAVGEALHLSEICREVYLIMRKDSFKAARAMQDKLKEKSNIQVLKSYKVNKFFGEDFLQGAELQSLSDNSVKTIEISGAFEAIGTIAENSMFISLAEFDEDGYIITGKYCQTKTPGLYAAGDSRSQKYRQLVTAASDGCVAASEAYKYITGIPY